MTAPHGPSDGLVEALAGALFTRSQLDGASCESPEDAARWWRNLRADEQNLWRDSAREDLTTVWSALYAEVRAAVVAEYGAALKAESNRRFRERTAADSLGLAFDGGIAEAADILLGIEKARALLPPVSAPGHSEEGEKDGR